VLKPVLAAACLCAASMAEAQSGLSGQQITDLVAGTTVEIDTPAGTKLPIRYGRDGKVAGDAGGLAWYLGAATDTGRWWVAADQLCHRWARWFNSEPKCIRLSKLGRTLLWQSQDGNSGMARITVPATIQAATALPALRLTPPPQEVVPPPASAPEAKAAPEPGTGDSQPAHAAKAPAAPAPGGEPSPAEAPAAQPPTAPAPAAPAPTPAPKMPPPTKQVEPKSAPAPLFMVANVRSDDVLNVRSGPSADFDIVGELPPGSRGIAITSECRSKWCPVRHHAASGWVNSAYLVPEAGPPVALHGGADPPPALRDSPEAPRSCLTPAARALLSRIEEKFGPVQAVSTCRPGALIAGTGRLSRHASGNAVDLKAGARRAAILEWLIANHRSGGIMTYAGMDHIHVDIGPYFVSIAGGVHWSGWRRARD
jgi:hypothetical protein